MYKLNVNNNNNADPFKSMVIAEPMAAVGFCKSYKRNSVPIIVKILSTF